MLDERPRAAARRTGLADAICRLVEDVLNVPPGGVGMSSSMATLGEWDSLRHLGIVLAVEEEFNCSIDPEEMQAVTSVDALVSVIQSKIQAS